MEKDDETAAESSAKRRKMENGAPAVSTAPTQPSMFYLLFFGDVSGNLCDAWPAKHFAVSSDDLTFVQGHIFMFYSIYNAFILI
jgi:hypothetical protein